MRTIVDIPEEQVTLLKVVGERDHLSRAELIRRAIADYINKHIAPPEDDRSFGLWKKRGEDGLAMQQRLREEWDS